MRKLLKLILRKITPIRKVLSSILLNRIARNSRIQIKPKFVKEQVIWLARASISLDDQKTICTLEISDNFNPAEPGSRRLLECLRYWVPLTVFHCRTRGTQKTFSFCSDDTDTSHNEIFSMDGTNIQWLVPDLFSMQEATKYTRPKQPETQENFENKWQKRPLKMFWRGTTTGQGRINNPTQLYSIPRVIICRQFNKYKDFDIKISSINCPSHIRADAENLLKSLDIWGDFVDESIFGNAKYYPDIPGNALAWGTIRKYMRGCLIFKPESKRELYYYRLIKPWVHFVPVKNNFSDLRDKFTWAENNPSHAMKIAWEGKQFATEYIHKIRYHFDNAITLQLNKPKH